MNISIGGSLVSDIAEPLLAEIRELAPTISACDGGSKLCKCG